MIGSVSGLRQHGSASRRRWRAQQHRIVLRGVSYRLRLTNFATGWLASVDTVDGPTLGCNRSPYLAVSRAVEPIGAGLVDAMSIVAQLNALPPVHHRGSPRVSTSFGFTLE